MTDNCRDGEWLHAELARRVDAEGRIAVSLVDLECHRGHQLLSTVTPVGTTGGLWAQAQRTLTGLWQDFETYRRVLRAACAVRDRRSRPGERELAELYRLLVEPSIEVSRTAVALPQRRLTGAVEHVETITLEQLTARMDAAFVGVSDLVVTCDAVHQAFITGLEPLAARLQRARALVAELAVGPSHPDAVTVVALTERVAELDRVSAADPMSPAAGPPAQVLAALDAQVTEVSQRLGVLATLRDGWADRLAELTTAVADIRVRRDDAERARQRAAQLIQGFDRPLPPHRLPALQVRLAALSGPGGPGGSASWPARAEALTGLRHAVDEAAAELRTARDLAAGLLDRRDELRGRFAAYRARAIRWGCAERPELLELDQRAGRLLWSRPCDIAAATRALAAYQRLLTGPDGPGTPGTPGRSG